MTKYSTQFRFLVLTGLVLLIFVGCLLVLYYQGNRQARMILEDKSTEKIVLLQKMVELTGRSLQSIANDYSLWDEMVTFIRTKDSTWARTNIYVGIGTYRVAGGWVFDDKFSLVYDTAAENSEWVTSDPKIQSAIQTSLRRAAFGHFFVSASNGIVEFRTAPIQPSDDDSRTSAPRGYFVVTRIWDAECLGSLSDAIGGRASVDQLKAGDSAHTHLQDETGTIEVQQLLPGADGRPEALLRCSSESPIYAVFLSSSRKQMIYFGAFCLGIMIILFVAVRIWVSRPLERVMTSLKQATPISEQQLSGTGVEFQHIGGMVSMYLEQRKVLEGEVLERKEAEATLRDREGLLRATLESTGDGILVVDRSGSKTHWNARFREMWHIPLELAEEGKDEAMIGFVLDQLANPAAFIKKVSELYDSSDESLDILEFKDGRFFERFSCPLLRDNDVVGRVWSFRDISQRKAAEEGQLVLQRQLEKAQRMESLGLLAGGVAHDLNNLLGPLVAYPEMILEELADDHPVREDIIRMGKSAEQASVVIQDLLAMARRGRYEMRPTDLNEVISAFIDSIAFRDLKSRRPKVVVEMVLASTPRIIKGSAPHLTKVIMNLIGNAIEACPVDGQVAVSTESKHLSRLFSGYSNIPEGEYVVLRVIDTGSGIAPEDIGKIFEPYFSKKKMGRSGSGLGLAVVHGIVQDHGGYYDVTSKLGHGTEFTFYFPMIGEQNPVSQEAMQDVRGKETVLVVDDDQDQRVLSTRLITSLGYHVTTASGGEEAVAYLKDHDVDILVLDMIMTPGIDGLETYRNVLTIKPGQRAIIATGFSSTDRVREMQRLGAGACISKPYHRDQIGQAIRDELSRTAVGTAVPS
jgi:signal transduction histidine kinase/ActR/RegA family two-component response regulator